MTENAEPLLRAILTTTGRAVFPASAVYRIICPKGKTPKQVNAFNLADGTRSQGEIAKQAEINTGNFSRSVSRWIEAGIMFRLGAGRDAKLMHIYPLPRKLPKEQTT